MHPWLYENKRGGAVIVGYDRSGGRPLAIAAVGVVMWYPFGHVPGPDVDSDETDGGEGADFGHCLRRRQDSIWRW